METPFKILFFAGVILFAAISVGFFLLIMRILLIFNPSVGIMGMTLTL